jgi:glycosyltransferase involved in cell wall biosynthesis
MLVARARPFRASEIMPKRGDDQRPVRVCIDLSLCEMFDRHGGIARYGAQLLRALPRLPEVDAARVSFCAITEAHRPPLPAAQALAWYEDPGPEVSMRVHEFRRRWRMPWQLWRSGVDLLHAIDPNLLPIRTRQPVVATCHDVIPLVLKPPRMSDERHAQMRRDEVRRFASVAHVIADSENTRRDAIRELGLAAERISVVHLGVDAAAFAKPSLPAPPARPGLPARYFVSVGSDYYRKNQLRLAAAWAGVADRIDEGLVLVGRALYQDSFEKLELDMRRRGLAERFVWLRDVVDAELPSLYHRATAAIAPSLYEGFGLTLLEAMAAGTPVVACANGTYEEVAGDAALYFDGESETSLAEQLLRVARDEATRRELVQAGAKRIEAFSWRATAEKTWQVYRRVLWPGS